MVPRSTSYSSGDNNNKIFQMYAESGVILFVLVNPPVFCPEDEMAGFSKMAWFTLTTFKTTNLTIN
jgi:hypothetical protein